MKEPTTTSADPILAAAVLRDAQASAWHEIKLAMRHHLDQGAAAPSLDDLDLLRAAIAEFTMCERARLAGVARAKGN